eukprot:Cvel_13923.t1-p1 / transcript=Cvel_13923.t1 / gene=Cvel_13923 / organism=Chromera_velia_CCMP2878 / gene_product=hypothetical protein / transcript_product=hypothetical protein / location=Cvel_scaffold971:447-4437(-) / protein_length=236 / sequence_SO=supercontig / SO=protein_coding / is_pseudo=false
MAPATNVAATIMFRRYAEMCPEMRELGRLAKLWNRKLPKAARLRGHDVLVLVLRFLTDVHPLFQHWTPSLWKDSQGRLLPAGCFYEPVFGPPPGGMRGSERILGWQIVDLRRAVISHLKRPWKKMGFNQPPLMRERLLNIVRKSRACPPVSLTRLTFDFFGWIGGGSLHACEDVLDWRTITLPPEFVLLARKTREMLKPCVWQALQQGMCRDEEVKRSVFSILDYLFNWDAPFMTE